MFKFLNKLSRLKKVSIIMISFFILFFISAIDWITGTELSVSIFYLIPVALIAWFTSKKLGVFFAFFTSIMWFLADLFSSHSYSHPLIPYWNTFVMVGIFISFSLLLSTLKNVIDNENKMASDIQRNLLPKINPQIPGCKIISVWEPTRVVSGDYYDFISLNQNKLEIALSDVCGHGFPAALLMSNLQAIFRITAVHNHSPKEVCKHLNDVLIDYEIAEKFTSFFYGILDIEKKEFTYSNAGHPPPIILRGEKEIIHLSNGGLLLGVDPNALYEQSTIKLEHGDSILFYTDGIVETRNLLGEEFGESRLIDFYQKNKNLDEYNFKQNFLDDINKFSSSNIDDDITLVVFSIE